MAASKPKTSSSSPVTTRAATAPAPVVPSAAQWPIRAPSPQCATCGGVVAVLIASRIVIGERVVEWSTCVPCELRARKLAS